MAAVVPDAERCTKTVFEGGRSMASWRCPNRAKEDGMCGVHLAGRRARAKNEEERLARAAEDKAREASAQAHCDFLKQYGIAAMPAMRDTFTSKGYVHTGGITLSDEAAAALVTLLERAVE